METLTSCIANVVLFLGYTINICSCFVYNAVKKRQLIEQWPLSTKYYIQRILEHKSILSCANTILSILQNMTTNTPSTSVWTTTKSIYDTCHTPTHTHTRARVDILLQFTAVPSFAWIHSTIFSWSDLHFHFWLAWINFAWHVLKQCCCHTIFSHKMCTKFALTKCPILYMFHTTTRLVIPATANGIEMKIKNKMSNISSFR